MKENRVLLVKIGLGRGTARKCKLNQDQHTNLFYIEEKGEGHGYQLEVIPAIKRFGCYYRIITLPDNTETLGNIFFQAKHYIELNDTPFVRKGLNNFIEKINKEVSCYLKALQKPTPSIETYFQSFV